MAQVALESAEENQERGWSASRLVRRELGMGAVFVFAIASIGLASSGTFLYSSAVGAFPGANILGIVGVSAAVGCLLAYIFAVIGAVAPHYGADYLVASRVLPPYLAFASSWTKVVFFALLGGSIAAAVGANTIPLYLRFLSLVVDQNFLSTTARWMTQPGGAVIVGTVVVVAIFILLILPPRVTTRVLLVGFALSVTAWVVIYIQFAFVPANAFSVAWDGLLSGQGGYLDHLQQARGQGMLVDFGLANTLAAGFLVGLLVMHGYTNPAVFAREVSEPAKNLLSGSLLALLVSALVLGAGAWFVQRVIPLEWLSAESFLFLTPTYRSVAAPWVPIYAAALRPMPFLVGLVGLGWVFSMMAVAHVFLYTASREMIAWSNDRLVPQVVSYVHPVFRSPVIAVLLVCMLALVGVVYAVLQGGFQPGSILYLLAFVQLFPVLAAALLPYKRPGWYASAGGLARPKIGPLPVLSLAAVLGTLYLAAVIAGGILLRVFGGLTSQTLILFAALFGSGLLWFFGRVYLLHGQEALEFRLPE